MTRLPSLRHWQFTREAGILLGLIFANQVLTERLVAAAELRWSHMDQICGYIESAVPTKKVIRRSNGKTETLLYETPIKGVTVALYRADNESTSCCDEKAKVGEIVTDQNGGFRFTGYAAGYYWLKVQLKSGEVKVPIRADKYDQRSCEARNTDRVIFADATPEPKVEIRIL